MVQAFNQVQVKAARYQGNPGHGRVSRGSKHSHSAQEDYKRMIKSALICITSFGLPTVHGLLFGAILWLNTLWRRRETICQIKRMNRNRAFTQ
ncbi:hypothetical protein Dda_7109 [Drechslerella dactyloides]|uniref:Transmembrane protein n=1 Tax=Drechslerella dactyloides TaxID=74499 RepID=A0AAD6NH60_DREDA|nr:hypothetical protein Dda_7109 [Drechslerella dactyloides]